MKIYNRKFSKNYEKVKSFEAGIVLSGDEVKSIRLGRINLDDAYVKMIGSEAYLINGKIAPYHYSSLFNYQPKRTRKLLLHKKEIIYLKTKIKGERLTIVPVSCYNKGNLIKLEIALVKGKKDIEKRKLEKRKDLEREEKRKIKEYFKR